MSLLAWVGVALLGGIGALARVSLDLLAVRHLGRFIRSAGGRIVVGTFAVNVSGAFLLGIADGLALTGTASVLAGTAALGAYTTFSTWMLQSTLLHADGLAWEARLNVALSLLVGLGAIALGRLVGIAL